MTALRLTVLASTFLALAAPATAQGDAVILTPSGEWLVDEECVLSRSFGYDGADVDLQMQAMGPGYYLVSLRSEGLQIRAGKVKTRFLPGAQSRDASVIFAGNLGEEQGIVLLDTIAPVRGAEEFFSLRATSEAEVALREKEVEAYLIEKAFGFDVLLATGPIYQALEEDRSCGQERLKSSGFAIAELPPAAERRNFDEVAQRIMRNYPAVHRDSGIVAIVTAQILIGADGRVENCLISANSSFPAFGDAACSTIHEHARYRPALDGQGEPVRSTDAMTAIFKPN